MEKLRTESSYLIKVDLTKGFDRSLLGNCFAKKKIKCSFYPQIRYILSGD